MNILRCLPHFGTGEGRPTVPWTGDTGYTILRKWEESVLRDLNL